MRAVGYFLGLSAFAAILAALAAGSMRTLGKLLASYRPQWQRAWLSCFAGIFVSEIIAVAVGQLFVVKTTPAFFRHLIFQSAVAFLIGVAFHVNYLRDRHDHRPRMSQAARLTCIQVIVYAAGATLLWFAAQGIVQS